jgi:hypothetical protein
MIRDQLTEEEATPLTPFEEEETPEQPAEISFHAITGALHPQTLRLQGRI